MRFDELALRSRSRIQWLILRCVKCGMVYVDPRPDPHTRELYSGDSYGFVRSSQADAAVDGRPHPVRVMSEVESHVGSGALLDVGCATGELLIEARRRGWCVQGVEISPHAARVATARGIDVTVGLLRELGLPANSFDAITLLDVIEHLDDPLQELHEIHRLLRPGGVICIETPNWRSIYRLLLGRRWAAMQPRLHILYFDALSLSRLLDRAGFEVVETKTEIVSLLSPEAWARGLGPSFVRSVARDSLVRLLWRMPAQHVDRTFLRLGKATGQAGDGSFRRMAEVGGDNGMDLEPAHPAASLNGVRWRWLRALNRPLDRILVRRGRGEQLRVHARKG